MNLSIIVAIMCILKVFSQNFVSAEASEQREITGSVNNESSLVTTMSVNQSPISQSLKRANQFAEPILSNFLQLLKNLNKVTRELGDSAPEREFNNFVTSTRYVNFRMVTLEEDYFAPKYIPKELSLLRARKDCMWSCANNQSCLAFNLYDTENYYVCEMLPDNLCVNRTRMAFAAWPGSTVWEKISTGMQQSCVDARFSVGQDIPCEVLRPGCFGKWPQCSICLRTCWDSDMLYSYVERDFVIWSDGTGPFKLPTFARCFEEMLQNVSKSGSLLYDAGAEEAWKNFATSRRYKNFRMITSETDYFAPVNISKKLTLLHAKEKCIWLCNKNESCVAFNVYESEDYFVCERLSDNLCVNRTRIAFAAWPGSTVWEKLSTGMQQSCVDARFPVGQDIPCEVLRPGCFGTWPQCSDCLRTCKDSYMLYSYVERDFVVWPDGIGPFKLPTFARCFEEMLQNVSKSVSLLQDAGAEEAWKNFATSRRYKNFRMITSETDYFAPVNISKKLTILHAKKECIWLCNKNESCVAFNVYESEDYFVCERLSDNLCENRTRIAFAAWPGSTVWEKLSTGMQQSCVDARFPVGQDIPCKVLRPGCFGKWPQCSNCLRTCKESYKLYIYVERDFVIWPDGIGPFKLPTFARCFKEMLQNVSKSVSLLQDAGAEKGWKNFATSRRYKNFRMITSETDYFAPVNISKKLSLLHAKEECIWLCNKNESCVAFNVYESEDYFVCERLSDNLCENRTRIAFAAWPGSTVWEKLSTGMQQSCVDARFPVGQDIPCKVLRPGCFGTWPQCSNCLRTCKDSWKVYHDYVEKEFTLWPEGDGDFVLPIFALCYFERVVMLKREVNVTNARLTYDYLMSLKDMHRISRLNVDSYILFEFFTTTDVRYYVIYINWQITANGMLANLTLSRNTGRIKDIFNLNGQSLQPTPFVTVTDDRFGCGSFWLLDSKNATHCPGGQVSMLGKLKVEGGKVISTGMSIPEATQKNEMIRLVRFRTW